MNKGVQTTEDALVYSQNLETKFENKEKKKRRKSEPDWMDDYVKELEKMEESS